MERIILYRDRDGVSEVKVVTDNFVPNSSWQCWYLYEVPEVHSEWVPVHPTRNEWSRGRWKLVVNWDDARRIASSAGSGE